MAGWPTAASGGATQPVPGGWPTAAECARVTAVALVATVAITLLLGQDVNWDYLNYHAYAAVQVFQDRLAQDYFGANVQSYLNPLVYLPLGAMQAMGWPAPAIASALAAFQALSLVFLYLVSRQLLGGHTASRRLVVAAATVLGAATGVFWSQAGSSFVDATLAPLVLAALWLLQRNPGGAALVGAGVLVGAGTGLKLTLAPYALALWLAAAALPGTPGARARRLVLVGAGAALGFALTYGYWGLRLYQEFGSPVFPLFNSVFQSPDYPTYSEAGKRFVPNSLASLLALPFAMAGHVSWVYAEGPLPDLRPALVVVLLAAWVLLAGWQRLRGLAAQEPSAAQASPRAAAPAAGPDAAAWPVLIVFFGVSLMAWLQTSTNGRYAPPTFLLLGPIAWALLERVFGLRAGRTLGLLLTCLQLVHLAAAGNPRWSPHPWTREMLSVQLPASLVNEPALFVTVGVQSYSYLAAHVHRGSAFTNPIGIYSLPTGGPGWGRFVALRDRWAGRTRVVFRLESPGETASPQQLAGMDQFIDRLGLSLDPADCLGIRVSGVGNAEDAQGSGEHRLVACAARLRPQGDAELARQRELARRIMNALQARCPRYFQPADPQVEGSDGLWMRRHNMHEIMVWVNFAEDTISFRMYRQQLALPIGRVSTWERDVEAFVCRLPHGGHRDLRTLGVHMP